MADVQPYLKVMLDRLNEEENHEAIQDLHKTIMITFTDLDQSYVFHIRGSELASLEERCVEKPDAQIITTSETFVGIKENRINPMTAYATRQTQTKGDLDLLIRLQYIFR